MALAGGLQLEDGLLQLLGGRHRGRLLLHQLVVPVLGVAQLLLGVVLGHLARRDTGTA